MAQAFAATHGVEVADIIMEHLPPEGWSELATKTDVATQGQLLRSEFDLKMSDLKGELTQTMSDLRSELTTQMTDLRVELKGEMAGLRDELKGELAEVRGGVNAAVERLGKEMSQEFAKQQKWMFTTMGGLFGGSAAIISAVVLLVK
jgi:hypothetical protein